jgi:hypothetical protein
VRTTKSGCSWKSYGHKLKWTQIGMGFFGNSWKYVLVGTCCDIQGTSTTWLHSGLLVDKNLQNFIWILTG